MNFIEIAKGDIRRRGHMIEKKDLHLHIDGEPLYRSMYLYDEKALEYIEDKGSLKGFFGERGIDNVLIDIDKKDNSNELTLQTLQSIVLDLEDAGIAHESLQAYFSGSGYHLVITNEVFDFKPSEDLHFYVKETMVNLFPDVDTSIYMRTGMYRVQHSLNKKTDLYKIPLTMAEVFNASVEEILKKAKEQRMNFPYRLLQGNGELNDKIVSSIPRVHENRKVNEPSNVVPCVQTMLNNGAQQGQRHNNMLRIVSHLKRHGIPSHFAKVILLDWNNNSLDEREIIEQVESIYNYGYKYGCNDAIMSKYCSTKCIYFKRKDYLIDVKDSVRLQEEYTERMTTNFKGKVLPLAEMFGLDQYDTMIYPGELVTIFGPTGSNKTTLAQNLALGVDFNSDRIVKEWQLPTLFLSLELSSWYMHRRHLQIVSGCNKEEVNNDAENIYKKHSQELQHLQIQTVSPTLENIQNKIKELQPGLVIVDYIDLVDTPPSVRGEYEQIKYISHSLSNMAVNLDVIIIQISQVSREYSRNDILDLYAGKGSGAIENASRKVIGLNGQADSNLKHLHMYKNTDGELFDVELEWRESFRLRRV